MRVLILHGWQGSGTDHWQTWLARSLADEHGVDVRYPELPQCDLPCPDRWGATLHTELRRLAQDADEPRVVVCHSLGCVLWLREARKIAPAHRVDRVVLVAPPCPGSKVPELARFYPSGADADAIANAAGHTRLVCSDNDDYCPGTGAADHWGAQLGLDVDLLAGAGHINPESGFGLWPQMLDWVLGRRETLTGDAEMAYGAKNGADR